MRMPNRTLLVALSASLLSLGGQAAAQRAGRGGAVADSVGAMRDSTRTMLEKRIRRRLWQVVRARVGLNAEQMQKLQATERSLDGERRALNRAEVATRLKLRAAALDTAGAGHDVATDALITEFFRLQHQRISLQEKEEAQLSAFMTPAQRIRFHALEDQVRRRVDSLRRQRAGGADGGGLARP